MLKKKRLICKKGMAVMLSALLVGSIAGCGNAEADTEVSSSAGAAASQSSTIAENTSTENADAGGLAYESIEKPAKISWCSHDGLLPENGQAEWDAEFERLTGIRLEHVYVTGNEYNSKIELDYAANTAPDVFDLASAYFPKYASEGALADLTELVKESGLYDLVDETMWEQCSYNGKNIWCT